MHIYVFNHIIKICRSQWPRGLRRRSSAARVLKLWVRIPPGSWLFVCCECCVLSGIGLCDGLIAPPGESYRLWRVVVFDQETSKARRLNPATGVWKYNYGGMATCLLWVLCVIKYRSLRRIDRSSRGVLPTVARRCVWSRNLESEEAKSRYRCVKIQLKWVVTPGKQTNVIINVHQLVHHKRTRQRQTSGNHTVKLLSSSVTATFRIVTLQQRTSFVLLLIYSSAFYA
jgi:hypothetical protein